MGPVNWLAVVLATIVAMVIGLLWNGLPLQDRRFQPRPARRIGAYVGVTLACFLAATMFGHSFARIGAATLEAKPWLYFMQTGGIALAFVIPAVWITNSRNRTQAPQFLADCLFWPVIYLAMAVVFWLLG